HEKGAFTGADQMRKGRFELADTGTLLLDEVSEVSSNIQAKLLRVLQEREFERVGGTKPIQVDVRIVSTSNRSLEKAIADGEFREDLFFRLNVVPIRLAPLRERPEEIPVLARSFLTRMKGEAYTFSAEAEAALGRYAYPGNIRELKNIVEYAAIFSAGPTIQPADLAPVLPLRGGSPPVPAPVPAGPAPSGLNLREQEVALIRQALGASPGNHSASARSLGITPQALYRRMKKYGLD
ncbi:MAG: sigma 54-interacting transcriptional regulator, partial [SAR324 cluster bacterium]|nr:sigma 54-interacting transcriptional regulator [SAR324 cluster bacterium]